MWGTQDRHRAPREAPTFLRAAPLRRSIGVRWVAAVLVVLSALLAGSAFPSSSTHRSPFQAEETSLFPTTEGPLAVTAPIVVSTYPGNCTANLSPWTNLSVRFSQPMDPTSTISAFSIAPPVVGASAVVSHDYLNWTLSTSLAYGTTYLVHVATSARSAAGTPMGAAWTSEFSTELASTTSTPQISATCPSEGARGIPLNASVVLSFDLPMNPSSLEGNFSIVPSVAGGQPGAGGYTLSWAHAHLFQANTTYRVEVSTAAESLLGVHLVRPVELNFTTGPAPGSGPSSTGGPGRSNGPTLLQLSEAASVGLTIIAVCVVATYAFLRRRRASETPASPSSVTERAAKTPEEAEGTEEVRRRALGAEGEEVTWEGKGEAQGSRGGTEQKDPVFEGVDEGTGPSPEP